MLTLHEIQRQIKEGTILIDPCNENTLTKPNSATVSIGSDLYTFDYTIVDTKHKNAYLRELTSDKLQTLHKVSIPSSGLLLEPRKVYLAKTKEHIMTDGYVPVINGRTSLSLLGISIELTSGYLEDHFEGNLLLSIVATKPTIIYPNIEIGNLTFFFFFYTKSDTIGMLSGEEIKRRIQQKDISITPLDQMVINPNSVNLTLYKEISYYKEPILDLKRKNPMETMTISDQGTILYPDKMYVARTNEWTTTQNLIPMLSGRSSLGRLGYHVHCSGGMGSIGYEGYWHMGIRTSIPIRIFPNMKCCQIYYFTPEGEITTTYEGSMQRQTEEVGSQFYKKMK